MHGRKTRRLYVEMLTFYVPRIMDDFYLLSFWGFSNFLP